MAKKRVEEPFDPVAFLAGALNDSVRKPNHLLYVPHKKQKKFHKSKKKGRQYIGGNRSGKTTGGINEDIAWLLGRQDWYRPIPEPPIIGRICTVDFKTGANKIIIPQLAQWLPPSALINGSWEDSYNGATHTLHLANKSELEIMSYDQELEKFAGVPRHFIHFDEEPPKDIFEECLARLTDYDGSWWMTMTPVEGMTWTKDEIFDPSEKGENRLIDVIKVNIMDNTYLGAQGVIDMLEGYSEDQIRIRGSGEYIAIAGLVFKHFDPDTHVIPAGVAPPNSTHYMSLDHGYSNPTAIHWHAVTPSGEVITYAEWYKSEFTVQQHAEEIKRRELEDLGSPRIFMRIADPAIKQRNAVTGLSIQIEYSQNGINLALGAKRSVDAGLDKMNNYLRLGKWFITDNCPNLIREMRNYQRAQYATAKLREKNNKKEEPRKKNDHAIDGCRYFFSYMPELIAEEVSRKPRLTRADIARLMAPGSTYNPAQPARIDENLFNTSQQQHFVQDEYVGEW